MKKIKTLLATLILVPTFVFAQASGSSTFSTDQALINPSNGMANIGGTNVSMQRDLYEGVKGSPMLCKTFVKGFIVTKDTLNKIDDFTYNFDIYKQELHIKYPDGKEIIPYNNQIRGFQLIDKGIAHNFKKATVPNAGANKFYEIIAETNQYSLLKLWMKKFVKANAVDRGPVTVGQAYDAFEEDETYYFKVDVGSYKEIKKLTKSNFIEQLPNRKTDIEAYWKTNKLSKKITEIEAHDFLKALEKTK
jgi:hypothetical protein